MEELYKVYFEKIEFYLKNKHFLSSNNSSMPFKYLINTTSCIGILNLTTFSLIQASSSWEISDSVKA